MIEAGSRWRLARTVRATDGTTLRSGRIVYVSTVTGGRLGSDRHLATNTGLTSCIVRTGSCAHTAEVLEVDLRPA